MEISYSIVDKTSIEGAEGVGFIVRIELTKAVINYSVISSRIIYIRIKASPINMTIIQVYAPTTSHSDEEIEEFYETIEKPSLTF